MPNASADEQLRLASSLGSLVIEAQDIEGKERAKAEGKEEEPRGPFGQMIGFLGDLLDMVMSKVLESVRANFDMKQAQMDGIHAAALALAEARGMGDPLGFAQKVMITAGRENLGPGGRQMGFQEAVGIVAPEIAQEAREAGDRERAADATTAAWESIGEMSRDDLQKAIGAENLELMAACGRDRMHLSPEQTGQLGSPTTPGHETPLDRAQTTKQAASEASR